MGTKAASEGAGEEKSADGESIWKINWMAKVAFTAVWWSTSVVARPDKGALLHSTVMC